ncbi:MAG: hypothetical protein NDI61_01915 [Bdellovibrionaceae bacterium]|nr:hypothetical protein [Pseudobdellovibrionaceae bacterium]
MAKKKLNPYCDPRSPKFFDSEGAHDLLIQHLNLLAKRCDLPVLVKTKEFQLVNTGWKHMLRRRKFADIELRKDMKPRSYPQQEFRHAPSLGSPIRANIAPPLSSADSIEFKSPRDKRIWILHCEGKSAYEIAEALPRYRVGTCSRRRISEIIEEITRAHFG